MPARAISLIGYRAPVQNIKAWFRKLDRTNNIIFATSLVV